MALVEPVLGEPAAVADIGSRDGNATSERALVVADYHAGIERSLRREGLEVQSRAEQRRERVLDLVSETRPDRVVFLGDLGHAIGTPEGAEHDELEALFDALDVPVTLVVGNHDGGLADEFDLDATPPEGARFGDVGFAHGHTWPAPEVLEAETVCVGHEHPTVRLEDEVGGTRVERAWLRGPLDAAPFEEYHGEDLDVHGDLAVFPAFNDLSGGTWVNVEGQEFLAPFLPGACPGAELYLLDGTRLGRYRDV
ncbi:metallophosphoesterase [Halobacterium sp. KA-4]|uniref:metallophosphoesterase n=1 Tax=Halobacterium sp. KA-4 TaxID=2896367 RepID=UPI001E358BDD|nr:metallophosphoesterase [Halobacterium sp. KA-4]MCD2199636.1 metallophosphoesterase [Halobacterium sp. KA-4]